MSARVENILAVVCAASDVLLDPPGSALDPCGSLWILAGPLLILVDACWILVGSLLDPCWILVGSLLDPCLSMGRFFGKSWKELVSGKKFGKSSFLLIFTRVFTHF